MKWQLIFFKIDPRFLVQDRFLNKKCSQYRNPSCGHSATGFQWGFCSVVINHNLEATFRNSFNIYIYTFYIRIYVYYHVERIAKYMVCLTANRWGDHLKSSFRKELLYGLINLSRSISGSNEFGTRYKVVRARCFST